MTQDGSAFREAWISGVKRHYPGEPKESYVTPWSKCAEWERECAAAVFGQVIEFLSVSNHGASRLSREQKGRFISLCWIAQIFKHIPEPKESYVADWEDLPPWQREVDSDIFEAIEKIHTR